MTLRLEVLSFQPIEKETLGVAWARFSSLNISGLDLSLPDHVLLQHFHHGLRKEAALFLDISLGGPFSHKSVSEGKAILDKILENTPYSDIYDEFREEEVKPRPYDQSKTTFTYPYGTYAYRRMSFGLCNAPASFQRCMVSIFSDMVEKIMEVFMDDFIIYAKPTLIVWRI